MKKGLLTLGCMWFLLASSNAGAQAFYKSYITSGSTVSGIRSTSITADSGLVFSVDDGMQKLDKYGNTEWARSVTQPTVHYSPSPAFMVASSTGSYFAAGCYNRHLPSDLDSNWITKFDHSGNSIYTWVYRLYIWNMCATDNGGFIIAGKLKDGYGNEHNYLMRCDSDMNMVWKKEYADTAMGYTYGIAPSNTAGHYVVMGGYSGLAAPNNFIHCFEIDGSGTVVWQKKYRTTASNLYNPYVLQKFTNGYLLSTEYANSSTTDSSWKLGVIKIDNSGNIIWAAQYNDPTKLIVQYNGVAVNSNNNILVTAQYGPSNAYLYYMLDSSGSVVWGKTSTGIAGSTTYGFSASQGIYGNRFFAIAYSSLTVPAAVIDNYGNGLCVSSPFTMTRTALPMTALPLSLTVADSPLEFIPVIPMTTGALTFHDTTYCTITTTGEEPVHTEQGQTLVYPNPAVSEINVAPRNEKWAHMRLIAMDGRVVTSVNNSSAMQKEVQISTANLPQGFYCLQIIYNGGEQETFKVVISK